MTRPAIRCLLGCVAAAASLATVAADPAAALAPAPRVTSVSPHAGPSAGGLRVTVGGSGFVGHPSVTFGAAAGTSVRVLSGTKLEVTAPKHAASAINVRVRTAGGTSATSGASEFTYVSPPAISSVSPTASSPDGGGPVTVRGYHFTGAARVRFGAVYATGVHVVSRNEVRATVPAHPADDVGVRVYDVGGVSDPQPFTYGGAPAPVTHLSVVDETPATATLSWTPSATTYVSRVVIVRSAGRTAPGSPSDGMQRASLTPTTTRFTDTGLTEGADYSYSVFASSTDGPPYSTPASITLATTSNSYPSVPTDVTVRPQATGSTSSPCDGTGFVTDTSALTFSASVSDPDDSDVLARFRFVDLGPVGLDPQGGPRLRRPGRPDGRRFRFRCRDYDLRLEHPDRRRSVRPGRCRRRRAGPQRAEHRMPFPLRRDLARPARRLVVDVHRVRPAPRTSGTRGRSWFARTTRCCPPERRSACSTSCTRSRPRRRCSATPASTPTAAARQR